ncbi:HTH domain-containing protein [Haloarcula marina]|uniref:HTH domain-containing protein n=1 Tax=Haloarcula marina TaxID=2961574 RepID=UPI0020B84D70|nr:HTH domain-containing protein [Halomicroarcula marina]
MHGSDQRRGVRAALYLRSLLPESYHQQQTAVLDRTAALVEDGPLAERNVHVWGDRAPANRADARTAVGEYARDRVTVFREWAAANGLSLTPAFEMREVDATMHDTHYRAIRFPAVLLAEYRGADLVCVTPHTDGDEVTTVSDRLAELEAGDPTQYEAIAQAAVADPPTRVASVRSVTEEEDADGADHDLLTTN